MWQWLRTFTSDMYHIYIIWNNRRENLDFWDRIFQDNRRENLDAELLGFLDGGRKNLLCAHSAHFTAGCVIFLSWFLWVFYHRIFVSFLSWRFLCVFYHEDFCAFFIMRKRFFALFIMRKRTKAHFSAGWVMKFYLIIFCGNCYLSNKTSS